MLQRTMMMKCPAAVAALVVELQFALVLHLKQLHQEVVALVPVVLVSVRVVVPVVSVVVVSVLVVVVVVVVAEVDV